IPGMPQDDASTVLAINNAGLMMIASPGGLTGSLDHQFFLFNGVRRALSDAITRIDGETPSSLYLVKLGNTGDASFNGPVQQDNNGTPAYPNVAYLFGGGVLTALWNGFASDINDFGTVLGTRQDAPDQIGTTQIRTTDGQVTAIPNLFIAEVLNNNNVVAG